MARNIQIVRRAGVTPIIQIEDGSQFFSMVALCTDRALRKLSHIIVHKLADLPHRPLKPGRPVDIMAALVAANVGPHGCGPETDGATAVDVFYKLVEDHHAIEDLIHSHLVGPFVATYTRRFIRWYGKALQARGVVIED